MPSVWQTQRYPCDWEKRIKKVNGGKKSSEFIEQGEKYENINYLLYTNDDDYFSIY
jgi:hypothetical protein